MKKLKPHELNKIEMIWKKNTSDQGLLNDDDLYQFGLNMINTSNFETAEKVFSILNERNDKHPNLGLYARKLSIIFAKTKNNDKNQQYEKIAISLL
jgi:outer membrane protein assembly factor BamD (BamD/ComL family)